MLDAVHFLAASWDLTGAAVISSCFSKASFSVVLNKEVEMEFIDESAWEMLQEDLSFACSFKHYVLPCELISIKDLCDESPQEKDPN